MAFREWNYFKHQTCILFDFFDGVISTSDIDHILIEQSQLQKRNLLPLKSQRGLTQHYEHSSYISLFSISVM